MKKVPLRTCVVSHEKCEKKDLLRVVRTPLGEVVYDSTGKLNGKGAYLKKSIEVINKAKKTKILEKALGVSISDEVYDNLERIINEKSFDDIANELGLGYKAVAAIYYRAIKKLKQILGGKER